MSPRLTVTVEDSTGQAATADRDFTTSDFDRILEGHFSEELVVPEGQCWKVEQATHEKNVIVNGCLCGRPGSRLQAVGVDESQFVGGGLEPLPNDIGVWVMGAGYLDWQGTPKTSWVRLQGSAAAGDGTLILDSIPQGWQVGDQIVVVPTELGDWINFEERIIVSLDANRVGLDTPLTKNHSAQTSEWGTTMTTEVLNRSRDAWIEGTPTGRSHVFIHSTGKQLLSDIGVRFLGPKKISAVDPRYKDTVVGRWGIHFHHAHAHGSMVERVLATKCGAHIFVPHVSNGTTWRDCVAYDNLEDPFWWDKFDQTDDTLWEGCVAAKVDTEVKSSLGALYGFVLGLSERDFSNTARGCVATGIAGGANRDTGGYGWLEKLGDKWVFQDCVSHNNRNNGMFNWLNHGSPQHHIERFVSYNNPRMGIEHGAYNNNYLYTDCEVWGSPIALENHTGSHKLPTNQRWTRCKFSGDIRFGKPLGGQREGPVSFIDCDLYGGRLIIDLAGKVATDNDRWIDVIDSRVDGQPFGPQHCDIRFMEDPDDLLRIQNGSEARKVFPNGSPQLIAPFFPYS